MDRALPCHGRSCGFESRPFRCPFNLTWRQREINRVASPVDQKGQYSILELGSTSPNGGLVALSDH